MRMELTDNRLRQAQPERVEGEKRLFHTKAGREEVHEKSLYLLRGHPPFVPSCEKQHPFYTLAFAAFI